MIKAIVNDNARYDLFFVRDMYTRGRTFFTLIAYDENYLKTIVPISKLFDKIFSE